MWLAPDISWIVSDAQQSLQQTPMTRALPSATPVPVVMEDVRRRRLKRKTASGAASAPAAQIIRAQNFVQPSAAQSVAGAPLPMVNEAGAPANVAAPRDTMSTRIRPADEMSARMRNGLKRIPIQPSLGCGKCRQSPVGCKECQQRRELWRIVHNQEELP